MEIHAPHRPLTTWKETLGHLAIITAGVLIALGAELKNAALTTAEVTGALGYMDYGEVSRYARIYDLQAQFMRLQERQGQHFFDVLAFVRRIPGADWPDDEDIRRWRSAIDLALADVTDREQIGRQVQKRYAEFRAAR